MLTNPHVGAVEKNTLSKYTKKSIKSKKFNKKEEKLDKSQT